MIAKTDAFRLMLGTLSAFVPAATLLTSVSGAALARGTVSRTQAPLSVATVKRYCVRSAGGTGRNLVQVTVRGYYTQVSFPAALRPMLLGVLFSRPTSAAAAVHMVRAPLAGGLGSALRARVRPDGLVVL